MPSERVKLRLEGSQKDGGLVVAEDFLASFENALNSLRGVQRAIGKGSTPPTVRITDLQIGSAIVELEIDSAADSGLPFGALTQEFRQGVQALRAGKLESRGYDDRTIAAFYAMVRPLRGQLRKLEITTDGHSEVIDKATAALEPHKPKVEHLRKGMFAGYVDAVNVHSESVFYLYPPFGPARLPCSFDRHFLLDDVRSSLKRFTRVEGLLEFVEGSPFPTKVYAERLSISPPAKDLPTLRSLWGSSKGITGGKGAVAFVRGIRDAHE